MRCRESVTCVVRFSLQNYPAGDYCVALFSRGELADNHGNFECPRYSLDGNRRTRRKSAQFFLCMIDQSLHVTHVKLTCHDEERAFSVNDAGKRRAGFRHSILDLESVFAALTGGSHGSQCQSRGCDHSMCPIFTFFVSRYLALCGLASLRIGTCSTISSP